LERGEVVLIPVTDLVLTEQGKQAASLAQGLSERQLGGAAMAAQRQVETELGMLEDDVRHARYVEVVERGTRCLGLGELSEPQRARIHRLLLEAYTALDTRDLAHRSCVAWLKNDRQAKLDPIQHSPKILAACESSNP
jgi:hypothetical protein